MAVGSARGQRFHLSYHTEAELRYGAKIMPAGKRQAALAAEIESMIGQDFGGRILPFDSSAAVVFAEIAAQRRQTGRPISQADLRLPSSQGRAVRAAQERGGLRPSLTAAARDARGSSGRDEETASFSRTKKRREVG